MTAQSSFESYLSRIARHPLLGKEGEITLAKEIEELEVAAWVLLLSYTPAAKVVAGALSNKDLAHASSRTIREADRERVLLDELLATLDGSFARNRGWVACRKMIASIEDRARQARQKFMKANLKLVVKISNKFRGQGLSPEDLIQEGNLGLIKAIDRYDYSRGFRFSTYGSWWIKHAIQRAVVNTKHTVRRPVHIQEAIQKVMRAQTKITADKNRLATDEEVAEMVDVSVSKVRSIRLQIVTAATASFDSEDEADVGATIGLSLDEPSPLDSLIQKQEVSRVEALLNTLKPIQATILR